MHPEPISRRGFLGRSLSTGAGVLAARGALWLPGGGAPAIVTSERLRPVLPSGIQSGDVTSSRAVVWSRADRPAQMFVDWATNDRFENLRTVPGPAAMEDTDYTASLDLRDLPPGQDVFYRVRFESLATPGTYSEPRVGRLRTAPLEARRLRVAWGGDVVGQGWGIDPSRGGMRIFEAIRRAEPDLFIHSGDIIYADQPLEPEVTLEDGSVYRNLMTEAKSKVAETLDEFRGNFAYNFLDENVRRFHASVPVLAQWDDHEVANNWFPGLHLDYDERFAEKSASLLSARARRALFEYVPVRRHPDEAERVYRSFSFGPMLDVFMLDLRSYRGPNTPGKQPERGPDTAMLGDAQLEWLKGALRRSRALWKVIASDMPVGLVVGDRQRGGLRTFEGFANADGGVPAGRELELADLLSFMKREGVRNTVWVTADVHYAAAHHYSPERAAFADFDPFWEFVGGPMHAGAYAPGTLDGTFGPEVRFTGTTRETRPNRPPSEDLQFFGTLDIDPATRALTAALNDVTGRRLWGTEIAPA